MILPIVLLAIWALVTVPMALVLLMDDGKPRRTPRRAPVIALGERRCREPTHHLPGAA